MRLDQFWRLLDMRVNRFQGHLNYHQKMHFCQRLKQKISLKLMTFMRWCSYSFVSSLCRKSNARFCKQEIVCVTVVKITTIVMDNHSWCYPACSQCHKKTDIETMSFTCPCGKDNDQPVLRSLIHCLIGMTFINYFFLYWYIHWQV